MPTGIDEKRKSLNNSKNEILEARVIANYGDPGIDENSHFDILSRFVIVAIESAYRVPTEDKWHDIFAVVARPEHLWVGAPEGKASSSTSQVRQDFLGNTNVGAAGDFSTNGITRINKPYELGELIKIKKIPSPIPISTDTSTFFISAFPDADDTSLTYNSWHTEGSVLPYFAGNQGRINSLRYKTIYQQNPNIPLKYGMILYKYQYEAFMLNLTISDSSMSNYLSRVFENTLPSSNSIYKGHGGYVFKSSSYATMTAIEFEDINIGNKQRIAENSCLPLIVSVPSQFPTPKTRTLSTINYTPTYSTIVKQ